MGTGPKIDFDQVAAAQKVVATAVTDMENVTKQILAQAGLSQAAMKAPAGQITATTFEDLGGGGRALSEVLGQLQADLGKLAQVAQSGSDSATSAARAANTSGLGASVASGM